MLKLLGRFLSHPAGIFIITLFCVLCAWSLLKTQSRFHRSEEYAQELHGLVDGLKKQVNDYNTRAAEASSAAAQEKIIRDELLMQKPGELVLQIPLPDLEVSPSPSPSPATVWQQWQKEVSKN